MQGRSATPAASRCQLRPQVAPCIHGASSLTESLVIRMLGEGEEKSHQGHDCIERGALLGAQAACRPRKMHAVVRILAAQEVQRALQARRTHLPPALPAAWNCAGQGHQVRVEQFAHACQQASQEQEPAIDVPCSIAVCLQSCVAAAMPMTE